MVQDAQKDYKAHMEKSKATDDKIHFGPCAVKRMKKLICTEVYGHFMAYVGNKFSTALPRCLQDLVRRMEGQDCNQRSNVFREALGRAQDREYPYEKYSELL